MRTLLFILIAFIALTTLVSGLLMISDPSGSVLNLSLSLLDGTPFANYRLPGILLTSFVGLSNLLAVFFNMQRNPNRYNWALAGGVMICGWIIAQMVIIRSLHWLQFIFLGVGILVILMAYQLKGKWAA